jgi:hypothetical protein
MSIDERTVSRPARVEVFQAVGRHPVLVVLTMLVFAAGGVGIGLGRTSGHSATAIVSVGPITVNDPAAVPGLITATQSLAEVYARTITATDVRARTRSALSRKGEALAKLKASPIPESPLIKVTATGTSAKQAVDGANAASRALVAHVRGQNAASELTRIYSRFRAAALAYVKRQNAVRRAKRAYSAHRSTARRRKLDAAYAEQQGALLKREALRSAYRDAQLSAQATPGVQVFKLAAGSVSDRVRLTQILGLIGLAAGLAVGAALATARSNRRVSRLARA